jgi:hypothetical protein
MIFFSFFLLYVSIFFTQNYSYPILSTIGHNCFRLEEYLSNQNMELKYSENKYCISIFSIKLFSLSIAMLNLFCLL